MWAVAAVPVAIALGGNIDVFLFVAQGLVLVGAAVVLVSQHQSAIGHAIGRLAEGSLHVRLGLAYPLARRFRTSMTLGMFALVVFILVMVSVFAAMFAGQVDRVHARRVGWVQRRRRLEPEQPGAVSRARGAAGCAQRSLHS